MAPDGTVCLEVPAPALRSRRLGSVLFGATGLLLGVATCTLARLCTHSGVDPGAGAEAGPEVSVAGRPRARRLREMVLIGNMESSGASTPEAMERRLEREDLPHVSFDPLSEEAQGMPGMPIGYDGDPNGEQSRPGHGGKPGCCSTEEEFGGLCYKKCSVLTNMTHPNRIAPDACCRAKSVECMLPSNVKVEGFFPGSGFNVAGDGGHPHPMGMCDGNEELHLGMCYKKCSILTSSEYPIRSAVDTCCKKMPCLWGLKTKGGRYCTGYGVGGGLVPAHRCPHPLTVVSNSV